MLDERGNVAWEDADPSLDESTNERFFEVALGADGDAIVTGVHAGQAIVRRYSSDGIRLWTMIAADIDGSAGHEVAVDVDGNVLALRVLSNPARGVLTKLSLDGEELSTYELANDTLFPPHAMGLSQSGNITLAWQDGLGLVLRQVSPEFDELWSTTSPADCTAAALALTADDNIVVGGLGAPTPAHAHLAYNTSDGTLLWERIWNDDPVAYLSTSGVAIDGAGRPIAAGLQQPAAVSDFRAPFVRKHDAEGEIVWEYTERFAPDGDAASAVAVDGTEHVIVVGSRLQIPSGNEDAWIAKLTP
ncbi:MAG TPA: hypothetical protein VG755_26040 [Nannocystaceae bacterium]|nr:hypothetical protein [Nannocystaceae bacterium]